MSISTVTSCRSKGYLFVFMGGDFESDNYEFGKKSIKTTTIEYTHYVYIDGKKNMLSLVLFFMYIYLYINISE